MKSRFAVLVILLMSGPLVSYGAGGADAGLGLQITQATTSGTIRLEITPSSGQNLRIWDPGNTWGAGRWRVLVVRNGRVETFFQNPGQVFTINVPAYKEIVKGTRLTQELDLNGGNWCTRGQCSRWDQHGIAEREITLQSGDMVVVVYDVPPSAEAKDMGVWDGVAAGVTTVP